MPSSARVLHGGLIVYRLDRRLAARLPYHVSLPTADTDTGFMAIVYHAATGGDVEGDGLEET